MIAYCHYKEDIIQRCQRFDGDEAGLRRDLNARKNLTAHDIQMLRKNATQRVKAYAEATINDAKPTIERKAFSRELSRLVGKLSKDVDHLFDKIRELPEQLEEGRHRQFFFGVGASLAAYIVILAVPDLFGWFAKRDAGTQIQQLRTEFQDFATEFRGQHEAIEPAADSEKAASGEAIYDLRLPAVPDAFRDEGRSKETVYDDKIRQAVWQKARRAGETNEQTGFRQDICGAWIRLANYGDDDAPYGWTIGSLLPNFPTQNGSIDALQPLHMKNAINSNGGWQCILTSDGEANVSTSKAP